ncbi:hypothetical protein [Streptomyces sp. NPDC047028]|uniref:hypothetical protein n=1 Tax=Streptomyces sp. NPDC047028 TaxID=3155793 RepID=UPI00340B091B
MGFINNAKANMATDEARKAYANGQHVLVYKFIEANKTSSTTAPMTGIGEQIQAVEAEGWALANMAAAESKTLGGERIGLVCLFRRR